MEDDKISPPQTLPWFPVSPVLENSSTRSVQGAIVTAGDGDDESITVDGPSSDTVLENSPIRTDQGAIITTGDGDDKSITVDGPSSDTGTGALTLDPNPAPGGSGIDKGKRKIGDVIGDSSASEHNLHPSGIPRLRISGNYGAGTDTNRRQFVCSGISNAGRQIWSYGSSSEVGQPIAPTLIFFPYLSYPNSNQPIPLLDYGHSVSSIQTPLPISIPARQVMPIFSTTLPPDSSSDLPIHTPQPQKIKIPIQPADEAAVSENLYVLIPHQTQSENASVATSTNVIDKGKRKIDDVIASSCASEHNTSPFMISRTSNEIPVIRMPYVPFGISPSGSGRHIWTYGSNNSEFERPIDSTGIITFFPYLLGPNSSQSIPLAYHSYSTTSIPTPLNTSIPAHLLMPIFSTPPNISSTMLMPKPQQIYDPLNLPLDEVSVFKNLYVLASNPVQNENVVIAPSPAPSDDQTEGVLASNPVQNENVVIAPSPAPSDDQTEGVLASNPVQNENVVIAPSPALSDDQTEGDDRNAALEPTESLE